MVIGRGLLFIGLGLGILGAVLAGCGQRSESAASGVRERTLALTPATVAVKTGFLTSQLQDLKVTEEVARGTGKVEEAPRLHATLKLRNTSIDQSVRSLAGSIAYVDAAGHPIALSAGRGDTNFTVYSMESDSSRLDPGQEVSQDIDVPFPSAAVRAKKLADIRLVLTYIPTPYKREAVDVPVTIAG